jgi:hypothetical protein
MYISPLRIYKLFIYYLLASSRLNTGSALAGAISFHDSLSCRGRQLIHYVAQDFLVCLYSVIYRCVCSLEWSLTSAKKREFESRRLANSFYKL